MKKFLCIAMCFVLCLSMTLPCYAASNPSSEEETILEGDNFIITGSVTADGTTILNEYTDGVLTQRNTVYANDPDHAVYIEHFGSGIARTAQREVIYATDYGTIETHDSVSPCLATIAGRIYFRSPSPIEPDGYVHYSVFCQYDTALIGPTTYTINGFIGKLIDLVALLVGALPIKFDVGSEWLSGILSSMGLEVVAGMIQDAFTATVAAERTDYTWQLLHVENYSNLQTATGSMYYVIDVLSHYHKTYYEGLVPAEWGTPYFASLVNYQMFAYNSFDVEKWG